MNIIKVLSHSNWGSDTKVLLSLFRSLVRSKLDYGCFVYRSAKKEKLECLNVLHRQGLRLCLGAFKSSPIESLYVEANEPPLELRRIDLAMRYALKMKANPSNPTYDCLFKRLNSNLYSRSLTSPPLGELIHRYFGEAGISKSKIASSRIPDIPIYQCEENEVSFKLTKYDKSSTLPHIFNTTFYAEILSHYKNYSHFYTDGSKHDELASYSVYSDDLGNISHKITDGSSIFTAEVMAIIKALSFIKISPRTDRRYVIFCDSKSVLESINNQDTKNPLMVELLDILEGIKSNSIIKFCWVPSHVGIEGNENADLHAKEALKDNFPDNIKIPYTDFLLMLKLILKIYGKVVLIILILDFDPLNYMKLIHSSKFIAPTGSVERMKSYFTGCVLVTPGLLIHI